MNKIAICLVAALLIQVSLTADCTAAGQTQKSVGVSGVQAVGASACVTECYNGYYLDGTADALSTICTACAASVPYTATSTASVGGCTTCPAGSFCVVSSAADIDTACPEGFYCPAASTAATACPVGQKSSASAVSTGDCTSVTTAITGCQAYNVAQSCVVADAGYVLSTGNTPVACAAGCKTCAYDSTNSVAGNCSTAQAGYTLGATASAAPVACTGATFTTDGNTASTCTACTASLNCATCANATSCLTCAANYVPSTTDSTVCNMFPSANLHPTCATAQGSTAADCNTCTASLNRAIATDSSGVALPKGACGCTAGYADYTAASATNFACMACGSPLANYASCTFGSTGALTAVTCASGSTIAKAGMNCAVLAASTAPAGFFFNSASNTFVACGANCNACTTASVCTACADLASTFVYPTASSDAKFGTYLTAPKRALWNGACSDNCPTGTTANSDKTNCTNTTGAAAGGAASGVFAVFALIASLFIVF